MSDTRPDQEKELHDLKEIRAKVAKALQGATVFRYRHDDNQNSDFEEIYLAPEGENLNMVGLDTDQVIRLRDKINSTASPTEILKDFTDNIHIPLDAKSDETLFVKANADNLTVELACNAPNGAPTVFELLFPDQDSFRSFLNLFNDTHPLVLSQLLVLRKNGKFDTNGNYTNTAMPPDMIDSTLLAFTKKPVVETHKTIKTDEKSVDFSAWSTRNSEFKELHDKSTLPYLLKQLTDRLRENSIESDVLEADRNVAMLLSLAHVDIKNDQERKKIVDGFVEAIKACEPNEQQAGKFLLDGKLVKITNIDLNGAEFPVTIDGKEGPEDIPLPKFLEKLAALAPLD